MDIDELKKLRSDIGALDKELLTIFAKRRSLSSEVAAIKHKNSLGIRDQAQEKLLLSHLIKQANDLGINASSALNLFHNIIEDSLRTQYDYFLEKETLSEIPLRLAVLGDSTSYSNAAANNHYSTKVQSFSPSFYTSFGDIFNAVSSEDVDLAILPIENTSSGNLTEVHDLVLEHNLHIVGEEKLKVKHCLIATESANIENITDVYSHPQAIAQCKEFLVQNPSITAHYKSSTSAALELVSEYQNPTIAAIASEEAANLMGLKIIQYGVNNYQENYTRFILISKKPIQVPKSIPAKISMVLTTKQQAGSLADCLLILKNNKINMTKLESRPIAGKPWQEMFFLDIEGNDKSIAIQKAIVELDKACSHLKILGCYPQHDILATKLDAKNLSD